MQEVAEQQQLERQAAALLRQRHGGGLRTSEAIQVQLLVVEAGPRVAVSLSDPERDQRLDLWADLPGLDPAEAFDLGLDFLDGVLSEILADEREARPPLAPQPYTFEGRPVLLSGRWSRPGLEAAADALLADAESED